MAYFRKQRGKWRAEVERNGVRVSQSFKTKAEAVDWAAHEESAILSAKRGKYPKRTLAEAMERYGETVSARKRGQRHELLRLAALQREFPVLAGTVLSEVDTAALALWRDTRLKTVSPGSVQRDINLLRNVFTVARDEWKWCGESPFKGLRMPGDNPARTRRIEPAEVKRICRWLGYRTGKVQTKQQEVALAFLLGLRTAMRAGELLSLTDARVDLSERVATVSHKTEHLTGKPRSIPLTKHGVRLMRAVYGRGRFFTLDSKMLDALFRKARDALMIDDLHFHDSRAEALTRMSRKVDVMTLARISGHKDLRTLMDAYYRESAADIAARL